MRERALRAQPPRVVPGRGQQRRGLERVDALLDDQRRRDPVDEPCHLDAQVVGFGGQLLVAAREPPQRVAGHRRRCVRAVTGTHPGGHRDQRAKS